MAEQEARGGVEVAFKLDLFSKICDDFEPGEQDWKLFSSARDDAMRMAIEVKS